jgi:dCTP deaminase
MILSAQSIRERVMKPGLYAAGTYLHIAPFNEKTIEHGRTYGLSSCSYDVRLAKTLWLFPWWGRLGVIEEYLAFPNDLAGEVKDKSSNARIFVLVQNTHIDPGFHGFLTVELTRMLPWPIRLKKGTPIAQIVFHQLDQPTEIPYRGKYQNQTPFPQPAIFDRSKP